MQRWSLWGDAMKRMRLSTLMLLIVIAALSTALVVREWRDARERARLEEKRARAHKLMNAQKANNGTIKQMGGAGDKQ
jgi:hypothetical protein